MKNTKEKIYINGIEVMPPEFICDGCGCIELSFKFNPNNKAIQMRCKDCNAWAGNYKYATLETYIMPFGKHKGEKLIDLPKKYLEWLYYNCDSLSDNLYEVIEKILERNGE
jgi:uncharacterized protein (DUF3820 family)